MAIHEHHRCLRRESQGQDLENTVVHKCLQGMFKATAKHNHEVFLNNFNDKLETDVGQNCLGSAFKVIQLLCGKREQVTGTTTSLRNDNDSH